MRLVEYLFDHQGYNPLIRPVRNLTEKIAVKFGLAMIQLINVVRTRSSFIPVHWALSISKHPAER